MGARTPGILFIVCAPSGAGKTSLVRALVNALPQISVSVSHTTRVRRPGEREGRDYYYVDHGEFERMIREERLLEHALVFDHYYGTSHEWVERALHTQDVILEIDWQGAQQVRKAFPYCVSVQVFPPSLAALEERLTRRGQDSGAIIDRRMSEAVEEMAHMGEFDYVVVNDEFEVALETLRAIVLSERARTPQIELTHEALIAQLLDPATVETI
ncbi:MAG: guanylate kinase [Gammaproteobacteria bacterium]